MYRKLKNLTNSPDVIVTELRENWKEFLFHYFVPNYLTDLRKRTGTALNGVLNNMLYVYRFLILYNI